MTEGVLTALITAASAVAVALVTGFFGLLHVRRQKRRDAALSGKVEVVREQVQNSHGTNLRDDIDRLTALVGRLENALGYVADDVRGLRKDIGRLDRRDIEDGAELRGLRAELTKRVDDLETTLNPRKDKSHD